MSTNKFQVEIGDLIESFTDNPLNYTLESELQYELKRLLQDSLEEKKTDLDVNDITYSASKHKKFLKAAKKDVEKNNKKIDRVHGEVYIDEIDAHIDVAVFSEHVDMMIDQGTKHFSEKDLEAAIEIKFVKNRDYATNYEGLKADIEKRLEELPESVEKHLIIIANKDIFRYSGNTHWEKKLQRLRKISDDVTVHYQHIPVESGQD